MFDIEGLEAQELSPNISLSARIYRTNGEQETIPLQCCIVTENEVAYSKNGGIFHFGLRQLMKNI